MIVKGIFKMTNILGVKSHFSCFGINNKKQVNITGCFLFVLHEVMSLPPKRSGIQYHFPSVVVLRLPVLQVSHPDN